MLVVSLSDCARVLGLSPRKFGTLRGATYLPAVRLRDPGKGARNQSAVEIGLLLDWAWKIFPDLSASTVDALHAAARPL